MGWEKWGARGCPGGGRGAGTARVPRGPGSWAEADAVETRLWGSRRLFLRLHQAVAGQRGSGMSQQREGGSGDRLPLHRRRWWLQAGWQPPVPRGRARGCLQGGSECGLGDGRWGTVPGFGGA